MTRAVFAGLALVLMPLAPAAAVVPVDMTASPASRPLKRPPARPAPLATAVAAPATGAFSIGEIGAALAGLAVLGLVRLGGRQPHSVAA